MAGKCGLVFVVLLVFSMSFVLSYHDNGICGNIGGHPCTNPIEEQFFNIQNKVSEIENKVSDAENKVNLVQGGFLNTKGICEFTVGCFEEGTCYPFGFIKEDKYCNTYYVWETSHKTDWLNQSVKKVGFLEQLGSGEMCSYDFECRSNFCFNGECVGSFQKFIKEVLLRISNLEEKVEKSDLNMIDENLVEQEEGEDVEKEPVEEIDDSLDNNPKIEGDNERGFLRFFRGLLDKNE